MKLGSLSLLAVAAPKLRAAYAQTPANPDYTIEIANGLAELGPKQIISTTLYNGQFPGPLLRFKEGQPVTVDIVNKTDHPELLHWHGQKIPSDVDDAEEEGSRVVALGATLRETFTPGPSGFPFYHTHVRAGFGATEQDLLQDKRVSHALKPCCECLLPASRQPKQLVRYRRPFFFRRDVLKGRVSPHNATSRSRS